MGGSNVSKGLALGCSRLEPCRVLASFRVNLRHGVLGFLAAKIAVKLILPGVALHLPSLFAIAFMTSNLNFPEAVFATGYYPLSFCPPGKPVQRATEGIAEFNGIGETRNTTPVLEVADGGNVKAGSFGEHGLSPSARCSALEEPSIYFHCQHVTVNLRICKDFSCQTAMHVAWSGNGRRQNSNRQRETDGSLCADRGAFATAPQGRSGASH